MVNGQSRAWIERLVAIRWWLLAVAVALGAAGAYTGQRLVLNRSIENMFAPDDPILVSYRRLQRTFGRHDVVLAVYADPDLKSEAGVARIRALREKLAAVPGVVALVSLVDLPGADDFALTASAPACGTCSPATRTTRT